MSSQLAVVYKLENIDADDGVDVFEIAPILMHFGELIRSANNVLGSTSKLDVRVKPFREGSWITEFVLRSSSDLLNYFKTDGGRDILLLMSFLGLNAKEGVLGVSHVIRFARGKISKFRKSGSLITYVNDNGEEMTVSENVHRLVQSPLIQNNYYGCVVAPLKRFPAATSVTIGAESDEAKDQKFTQEDIKAFEEYARSELLGDVEKSVSLMNGVFIKPKRGSYSGLEQQYSFMLGDTVLWPTTIEDSDFLSDLRSGDVRLFAEDVLKVNMEVHQDRDARNKVSSSYRIIEVVKYIKYERPIQPKLSDMD